MGRNKQGKQTLEARRNAVPYSKLKKDPGVPKLVALKKKERNHEPGHAKAKTDVSMGPPPLPAATIASLAMSVALTDDDSDNLLEGSSSSALRDSTVAAHAHQFKKVLELSDVIIQVLDARDPMGCRSRVVEDEVRKAGGDKMLILALNKTDLVPKDNVLAWLRYLRHDYPTVPLKSSTSHSHHSHLTNTKNQGAPHLLTLLKSFRRAHSSLTVGIVGPPNVGKSSLINSLSRLRSGGKGGDVVTVGAKPGETRDIKEVGLEKGLKVLDMPGIVWGDFLDGSSSSEDGAPSVGSLNMMGVEFLEDPVGAVDAIVSRVPPETLQQLYSVPVFANSTEFLVMVALSRGRLGKGGAPDQVAAARSILNDWNSGVIPYHTVPPKFHSSSVPSAPTRMPEEVQASLDASESAGVDTTMRTATDVGAAQYVSKFSQSFDLAGLFSLTDSAVLDDCEDPQAVPNEDEAMDMGDGEGEMPLEDDQVIDDDLVSESTRPAGSKRGASPTPSITTIAGGGGRDPSTRPQKLPRPKRVRYNPNAPIVIDPLEVATMASSNPLNRKRLKEDAKRKKRADNESMTVDDEYIMDSSSRGPIAGDGFIFKPSVSAFAALAEVDVPLPDEDEEL